MEIKKLKELKIDSDVYILETTSKRIFINNNFNDDVVGVNIFNHNLELLADIPIAKDLSIYEAYKHFSQEKILLYCPDDDECLIYIDLEKSTYKIIELNKKFADITFGRIYLWNDDDIILSSHSGNFYRVFTRKGVIVQMPQKEIERDYPAFFQFYTASKEYTVCKAYPGKHQLIFRDEAKNQIGLYDFNDNKTIFYGYNNPNTHDYLYQNGTFVFITEDQIDIVDQNAKKVSIKALDPYMFLRVRFLNEHNNDTLLVLSGDKYGGTESVLTIYECGK